ncbi:MAG: nucleotidyltransferase domain-containing protein [Desulfobacterales bacterium]|nr:nucleotidyltransferase domain-containing protein [Desulfobacterales bacterium]
MLTTQRINSFQKQLLIKAISEYLQTHMQDIAFAYLFGSFLQDSAFSDIDIGVFISGHIESPLDFELELESELENISKYQVDVRILNHAPLPFVQNVIKTGRVLFDHDPNLRADFEGLTLKKYFDFSRFRRHYLHEVINAPI